MRVRVSSEGGGIVGGEGSGGGGGDDAEQMSTTVDFSSEGSISFHFVCSEALSME